MPWTHLVAAFFAGAVLANAVPHFVHGISGDSFPTPFARPPGKGLSSPPVNVLWALLNFLIGYLLFRFADLASGAPVLLLLALVGVAATSLPLSISFQQKHSP